jgi:hypothetical protein
MLQSAKGIFHAGKIELAESPPEGFEGPVIVTFLSGPSVDLASRGIRQDQAEDLRRRLSTFAEDWQQPEMDVYDAL